MLSRARTVALKLPLKVAGFRNGFIRRRWQASPRELAIAFFQRYNSNGSTRLMEIPDYKSENNMVDMREESPLSDPPEENLKLVSAVVKPKRQRKKNKATNQGNNNPDAETKTKRGRKRKAENVSTDAGADEVEKAAENDVTQEIDEEKQEKPKRVRKRKTATQIDGDDFGETEKKKRRRKTPEEDKRYDIPPIENTLSTTFKGRLGYACLNSLLRKYSTPIFCSRTCRLATLGELGHAHARQLAQQNLADLHTLIMWNAQHHIFFMRMSSEMFPFASHPEVGYALGFADTQLKEIGKTARELGVRLTSHPGQFTQLGSPSEKVVSNAFRDLNYHCEIMDRMGLDQDGVMIIHMGGVFGDKAATLSRFRENYAKLSENVKGRLVLENDEICYNVDDLLPLCQELNIPLVFDYHHDWIYPSSRPPAELIPDINALWIAKGIRPKQHLSEPRPGAQTVMEKRAHADRVARLPPDLPDDMDLMLECKDKEQAVFYIYRLYNLFDVDPSVLRPPATEESLRTKGRKSNKRAKAKALLASKNENEDDNENFETQLEGGEFEGPDENVNGEADGDQADDLEAEVKREAEAHDVPPELVKDVIQGAKSEGDLDCGSGDEGVYVEDFPNEKAKKVRKKAKKQAQKGEGGKRSARGATKEVV